MNVELEFIARPQFLPYLNRKERWSAVVAHRRAGKTVACIMDLIRHAAEHTGREPRFAYIAPTYTQAKDVAWGYRQNRRTYWNYHHVGVGSANARPSGKSATQGPPALGQDHRNPAP